MYSILLGALRMELRPDDIDFSEDAAVLANKVPSAHCEGPDAHREPERWALFEAVGALHNFLHNLDGDTFDYLAEYISGELGNRGPRYVLGP